MFSRKTKKPSGNPIAGQDGTPETPAAPKLPGAVGQISMLLALEPRFMFDAAAPAAVAEVADAIDQAMSGGAGDPGGGGDSGDDGSENETENASPQSSRAFSAFFGILGVDNEAPTIDLSGAQFVGNEDTPISLSGIIVADAESDRLHVTLVVEHGRLYDLGGNRDDVQIDGGASTEHPEYNGYYTTLVFTGSVGGVNEALGSLKYQGDQDWYGTDSLSITVTEENENYRTDPAIEQADIVVHPVNDLPAVIGLPEGNDFWTVEEDGSLFFHDGQSGTQLFSLHDPDAGDTLTVTFTVTNGGLRIGTSDLKGMTNAYFANRGLSVADAGVFKDGVYTLSGSVDALNALIRDMNYTGDAEWYGEETLTITAEDDSSEQSGIVWTAAIRVTQVDDPPVWYETESKALAVDEGGHKELSALELKITDIDTGNRQINLVIAANPARGVVQMLSGSSWIDLGVGSAFSYADVIEGRIRYLHDGSQVQSDRYPGSTDDSFKIYLHEVVDVNGDPVPDEHITVRIAMNPVNDLPALGGINATVYEGERGAVITFDIVDPDQKLSTAHKIAITGLPVDGTLYYFDANANEGEGYIIEGGVKKPIAITTENMENFSLSLLVIQAGGLTYTHNGNDGSFLTGAGFDGSSGPYPMGATRPDGFTITIVDDGGGTNTPCAPVTATIDINVLPSNDLPYFHREMYTYTHTDSETGTVTTFENAVGAITVRGWNDNTLGNATVNGDTVLTRAMLDVRDNDSPDSCLTYTLVENTASGHGSLYIRTQITLENGETAYRYREIGINDSFTQADVDAGRVVYRYSGVSNSPGSQTFLDAFGFNVRDGSISVVDTDGTAYPDGFEGGVGTIVVADGKATMSFTTARLVVDVDVLLSGEGGPIDVVEMGEEEISFTGDQKAGVYEDGLVFLTAEDLNAKIGYYKDGVFTNYFDADGNPVTGPVTDPSLVYRIEKAFASGTLYLREYHVDSQGNRISDGEGGYLYTDAALGLFDSFRQGDVSNGLIYFKHDGSEAAKDTMTLTISNGRIEYGGDTATPIEFTINARHVNDTPSVSGSIEVTEGPTADQLISEEEGFVNLGVVLDDKALSFSDPDKGDPDDIYGQANTLTFVIVGKPAAGGVFLYTGSGDPNGITNRTDWIEITYASEGQAYANPDWSDLKNADNQAVTVLTMDQLKGGHIRYIHDGSETYQDALGIIVNDNKGIPKEGKDAAPVDNGNNKGAMIGGRHASSLSELQTINVKIIPVNDAPVFHQGTVADELHTVPFGQKDGQHPASFTPEELKALGVGNQADGLGQLVFTDADHANDQIIYRITENTRFGTLWLKSGSDWHALGAGSEFTQADVEAGLVCYIHNGTESHVDSFTFYVTDKDKVADASGSYVKDLGGGGDAYRIYNIAITQENATPTITRHDLDQMLYLNSSKGIKLSEKFSVDDPDYYAIDGVVNAQHPHGTGIKTDEMQLTLEAKKTEGGSYWGYFELRGDGENDNTAQQLADLGLVVVVDTEGKLVLTGSRALLNAALANLYYMPSLKSDGQGGTVVDDLNAEVTLSINLNDLANGDPNSNQQYARTAEEKTAVISVSPLNDQPVVEKGDFIITTYEDVKKLAIKDSDGKFLEFSDADHFNMNVNKVILSVEHGTLAITSGATKLYKIVPSNGNKTITIYGTNEAINQALETLTYTPIANWSADPGGDLANPANCDTLKAVYWDGADGVDSTVWGTGDHGALSCETTVKLIVLPVNDDPTVSGPDKPVMVGTDSNGEYPVVGLDGKQFQVADIDITGDGYGENYVRVVISLQDSDGVAITGSEWGSIDIDSDSVTLMTNTDYQIEISGTLAAVNNALTSLTYTPSHSISQNQDSENAGAVSIKVEVFDGDNGSLPANVANEKSDVGVAELIFNQTNAQPFITFGGGESFTIPEDDPIGVVFEGGTLIQVGDPDKALMEKLNIPLKVTITPTNGTVTLNDVTTDVDIQHLGDGTIILVGKEGDINSLLDGMSYISHEHFNGKGTITITVDDQDSTSVDESGSMNVTRTINIEVTPDNDLPVIKAPNQVTLEEDGDYTFNRNNNLITFSDVEIETRETTDTLTVELTLSDNVNGALAITGSHAGVTIDTTTKPGTIILTGATESLNTIIKTLQYTPNPDWNGDLELTVVVKDIQGGESSHAIEIIVKPVNDAPRVKRDDGSIGDVTIPLTAIPEDASEASGELRQYTIVGLFGKYFNDARDNVIKGSPANELAGVVVVATSDSQYGAWEFSTDGGGSWSPFPAICSETSALFLAKDALVRFVPAKDYNGIDPSLTVRLVDDSVADDNHNPVKLDGMNGETINTTEKGSEVVKENGTTRFSKNTITVTQEVTSVNDLPVITAPDNVTMKEDGTLSFNVASDPTTTVKVSDVDFDRGDETGSLTLDITVDKGSFKFVHEGILRTHPAGEMATADLPLNDLNALLETLQYIPGADWNGEAQLTLKVTDTENGSHTHVITITVDPVNDAPQVKREDGAIGDVTIALDADNAIPEDANEVDGNLMEHTVEDLFGKYFVDDRDNEGGNSTANELAGVVVVATSDSRYGAWEFSTDGGSNWSPFPATCSETSALFLAKDALVRFVPAKDYNGDAPSLTVRLVDDSAAADDHNPVEIGGMNGKTINTTEKDSVVETDNGTTRFSKNTITVTQTVTPVNDLPVITARDNVTMKEDGTLSFNANSEFATIITVSDVDMVPGGEADQVTVTLSVTTGAITIANHDGVVESNGGVLTLTGTLDQVNAALLALQYKPEFDWNGGAVLTVTAKDTTGEGAASHTVAITVEPVNDAPVAEDPSTEIDARLIIPGTAENDLPATSVWNLFHSRFDDSRDFVEDGSSANEMAGVVVVGNSADASGEGVWKFFINDDTGWNVIPTDCADDKALFLDNNALIRFVPVGNYRGDNPTLSVRLVDDSAWDENYDSADITGKSGETIDSTRNGNFDLDQADGTTRFSKDVLILRQSVAKDLIVTGPTSIEMLEDGTLPFTGENGLKVYDPNIADPNTDQVTVTIALSDSKGAIAIEGHDVIQDPDSTETAITLTGTQDQVNAALADLVYTPAENWNGDAGLTVSGTGHHNVLLEDFEISVTVIPVNDIPIITGDSVELDEDTDYTFTDITIFDVEASSDETTTPVVVTLKIGAGSIDIADGYPNSVDITDTPGGDIVLTGHPGDITTALEYLVYTPGPDWNGATQLTITADDQEGGVSSKVIEIVVNPVNDAPAVTGSGEIVLDGDNVLHSDVPETDIPGHAVSDLFSGVYGDSRDTVADGGGSTADPMAGVVVVENGAGAHGQWQYSLDGKNWTAIPDDCRDDNALFLPGDAFIRFVPAEGYYGDDPTLDVRLVDGSEATGYNPSHPAPGQQGDVGNDVSDPDGVTRYSRDTVTLKQVVLENTPPEIAVPDTVTLNEDGSYRFNDPGALIGIADAETDPGTSIKVTLTVDSGSLAIAGHDLITTETDVGVVLVGTLNEINAALRDLVFTPEPDWNGEATLTVTAFDRHHGVTSRDVPIAVIPVNDPPAIHYQGGGADPDAPLTMQEEGILSFVDADAISFSDIDVGETPDGRVTVTLSVEHGALTLGVTDGISGYPAGGGRTLVITGFLADVNAAVASLRYTGYQGYSGADRLAVRIDDNGNTGGGALRAELDLHIQVLPNARDPIANDDAARIDLSPYGAGRADGNILDNDFDPDGTALTVVEPGQLSGRYGTLVVAADGGYSYVVDSSNAAIRALRPGDLLVDEIAYSIRDGNGGAPAGAVLRIEIATEHLRQDPPILEGEKPPVTEEAPTEPENALADDKTTETETPVYNSVASITPSDNRAATEGNNESRDRIPDLPVRNDFLYDLSRLPMSEDIILKTMPENRNVYIDHVQELHLPESMFVHTNPSENLRYEARLADGSPLPGWIEFDPEKLLLKATPPPEAEGTTTVVILVRDSAGNFSKTELTVKVRKPEELDKQNDYRDPDILFQLGAEPGPGGEGKAAAAEGVGEDGAPEVGGTETADDLDAETTLLLRSLLDDAATEAESGDAGEFTASLRQAGNTGLWVKSVELVGEAGALS